MEKTQEQLDTLRNLTWQNGKLIEQNQQLLDQLENGAGAIGSEIMVGKQALVDAIEHKGGESSIDKSLQGIAQDIEDIPNFPTTGFEYVSEDYRPRNLVEAYNNRLFIKSINDDSIKEISGNYVFYQCSFLSSVVMRNLVTITGLSTFNLCNELQYVFFQNLISISTKYIFGQCGNLKIAKMPSLAEIYGGLLFGGCAKLQSIEFGTLWRCDELLQDSKINLRNITIGVGTDINLPFQYWTATNVIAEGQSGIDELNNNLRTNLLEKLADHSTDGQTRTLRLGWLSKVSQENIDYANSKGWTLTT